MRRAGLPPWTVWAVLGASAVPLLFLLVEVQRLLLGDGPSFLLGTEQQASTYARVTYFLQVIGPDRVLLLPLLALGAAAWLREGRGVPQDVPRADLARTCATMLTAAVLAAACAALVAVAYLVLTDPPPEADGSFFGGGDSLDSLGPSATATVVLAVLAALLLRRVLAERAAVVEATDDEEPAPGPVRLTLEGQEREPAPVEPPPPYAAVPVRLVETPPVAAEPVPPDDLAAYRRPSARPVHAPAPAGREAAPPADADSPFRRPSAPVLQEQADPLSAYRRS